MRAVRSAVRTCGRIALPVRGTVWRPRLRTPGCASPRLAAATARVVVRGFRACSRSHSASVETGHAVRTAGRGSLRARAESVYGRLGHVFRYGWSGRYCCHSSRDRLSMTAAQASSTRLPGSTAQTRTVRSSLAVASSWAFGLNATPFALSVWATLAASCPSSTPKTRTGER
jgi:hypothetical protein